MKAETKSSVSQEDLKLVGLNSDFEEKMLSTLTVKVWDVLREQLVEGRATVKVKKEKKKKSPASGLESQSDCMEQSTESTGLLAELAAQAEKGQSPAHWLSWQQHGKKVQVVACWSEALGRGIYWTVNAESEQEDPLYWSKQWMRVYYWGEWFEKALAIAKKEPVVFEVSMPIELPEDMMQELVAYLKANKITAQELLQQRLTEQTALLEGAKGSDRGGVETEERPAVS